MPIRAELRPLYPSDWRAISNAVRFARAGGVCEQCGRPHLALVRRLNDGRWYDPTLATWRDDRGRPARWPRIEDWSTARMSRVVLAAAHKRHNPKRSALRDLRCLCQRCHLLHDRPYHTAQRRLNRLRAWAMADLFSGPYPALAPPVMWRACGAGSGS